MNTKLTKDKSKKFSYRYFIFVAILFVVGIGPVFAEDNITSSMANLVIQIGIILFAVRLCGGLVKKIGIPSVLGELLAGVIIGPYALGGIALPGFPEGIFPINSESLAVSPELYSFSTVASIILLFASGLETDFTLFLKYSVAGGIVGIGGVIFSFGTGAGVAAILLNTSFMDPRCLFLGVMSTATSVGITARILSNRKKMDSPEGVTTLAAAVFDDVLGVILLAVILGIVSAMTGTGGSVSVGQIGLIAAKAFGIWLGFTVLGLIFSKKIAGFLKLFRSTFDFSICALGIALLLAGVFEKQGLAMIIGAYVTGLSLSGTDIAAIIEERIHGLYEFFVPLFFAVMGMMVNIGELLSVDVMIFGLIYTVMAILAKVIGCGLPTLALGFNIKGALRIGTGMIPRGEVALIIAGIGMTAGILNEQLFGVVIMMTLVTTIIAPPLLNSLLKIPGKGTKKETVSSDSETMSWDFGTDEIADLVIDTLIKELKREGFYVQMMNIDEGLSQARKGDLSVSITEQEQLVSIEASANAAGLVRTLMYEVVLKLNNSIQELKESCDPLQLKRESQSTETKVDSQILKALTQRTISTNLKGTTKKEVLHELTTLLGNSGQVCSWETVLEDVLNREETMSTGMEKRIAIPHAKTDGVKDLCIAIGIHKAGIDFGSLDGKPSKLFVLIASPKHSTAPHLQALAATTSLLRNEETVEKVINANTPEEIMQYLLDAANHT